MKYFGTHFIFIPVVEIFHLLLLEDGAYEDDE